MNLDQVIERLTSLRDNGYAHDGMPVVAGTEHVEYRITDIDTDGNEVVISIL